MRSAKTFTFGGPAALALFFLTWPLEAVAADLVPELGTWEITMPLEGGREFKATVTFIRKDGGRVHGVMEWRSDGPQRTLELFVAQPDIGGSWTFVGREEHTRVADQFPAVYRATLGAKGRTFSEFVATSQGSTGVIGSIRWVKAATPTYNAVLTASLNLKGDRPLLYQQCSGNYVLDGDHIHHGPDSRLLAQLAKSKDKHVAGLAEMRTILQELHDQSTTKDAKQLAEWAKGDLERRARFVKFFAEALRSDDDGGNTGKAVVSLFNSLGFEKAFDRQRSSMELACVTVLAMNQIQADIRKDYIARNPKPTALPARKFTTGFKVAPSGRVFVTLRNDTGSDLRNVAVSPKMVVDKKRLDAYEQDNAQKERMYGAIGIGLGIDMRTVGSALKLEDVLYKYFRIDKSLPVFVPLWPKGKTLEVEIGMSGDLSLIAASAGAWLGSDEGAAELSFDLDVIRRVIRATPAK